MTANKKITKATVARRFAFIILGIVMIAAGIAMMSQVYWINSIALAIDILLVAPLLVSLELAIMKELDDRIPWAVLWLMFSVTTMTWFIGAGMQALFSI